ncbi:hypothetical protein GALMADRAFT_139061 [Galerina marginata CBS 339.88]|uniref:Uncharacterized protein n=1 Tax=Galerina marginata (strain CBS 339.88) TaxID=685588 RepID=A0A067T1P6_GALM3|nr:hypothetical protein GALMADRAFT_139061 [Galerina marginata CBS 339.88]
MLRIGCKDGGLCDFALSNLSQLSISIIRAISCLKMTLTARSRSQPARKPSNMLKIYLRTPRRLDLKRPALAGQAMRMPASQPLLLHPASIERSQSTSILVTQSSIASIGPKTDDEKRAKFDEHYQTATLSDEGVLSKQMKQWTYEVYEHFKMPPAITVKKGEFKAFVDHGIQSSTRRNQTHALAIYTSSSHYSAEHHRVDIALWVSSSCHRRFLIVEDAPLLEICSDLNPNCVTPKRRSVSSDGKEAYISRKEFAVLLRLPRQVLSLHGGGLDYEFGLMSSYLWDEVLRLLEGLGWHSDQGGTQLSMDFFLCFPHLLHHNNVNVNLREARRRESSPPSSHRLYQHHCEPLILNRMAGVDVKKTVCGESPMLQRRSIIFLFRHHRQDYEQKLSLSYIKTFANLSLSPGLLPSSPTSGVGVGSSHESTPASWHPESSFLPPWSTLGSA